MKMTYWKGSAGMLGQSPCGLHAAAWPGPPQPPRRRRIEMIFPHHYEWKTFQTLSLYGKMFSVCKAKNSKATIHNSGFNMFLTVNISKTHFYQTKFKHTKKNLLYFDSFTTILIMLLLLEITNKVHIIIYFTKFWEHCHKCPIGSCKGLLVLSLSWLFLTNATLILIDYC